MKESPNNSSECEPTCRWEGLLSNLQYKMIDRANAIGGVLSLFFATWMSLTILSTSLRSKRFFRNFVVYTLAVAIHRGVPALVRLLCLVDCFQGCVEQNMMKCQFLACWDTFFEVFELEMITQICIERGVYAFYLLKVWRIPRWHNRLYLSISLALGMLYSHLPLYGYGRYCRDLTCDYCAFDVLLPKYISDQIIVVGIYLMKTYKPLIFMALSMVVAYYVHLRIIKIPKSFVSTRATFAMMIFHNIFWMPLVIAKTSIIVSQFLGHDWNTSASPDLITLGMIMNSVTPAVTLIVYLLCDQRTLSKAWDVLRRRPEVLELRPETKTE